MNLRKLSFFLTLLTFSTSSALWALPEDREKRIESTADTTTIDLNTNKSVLTGHVVITQGMLTIYADRVELENDPVTNKLTYVYAIGNPVRMIDTPTLGKPPVHVNGHTIEYFPDKSLVITNGDAVITRASSEAHGERIEYNSLTGLMTIKAKRLLSGNPQDNQAELIIEPGDVQ